jgi:hypothetical protein
MRAPLLRPPLKLLPLLNPLRSLLLMQAPLGMPLLLLKLLRMLFLRRKLPQPPKPKLPPLRMLWALLKQPARTITCLQLELL